jgi:hypothetical protein
MPNWCDNNLVLKHDDPAMIDRAEKAFNERRLLEEFVPVPAELKDTTAGFLGEGTYAQRLLELREKLNEEFFKHKNWWDFCVKEWGTKWDVGGDDGFCQRTGTNELTLSFNSAWSPPVNAYEKMAELGFHIAAYYFEGGIGFCGSWDSENGDAEFSMEGITSKNIYKRIPSDIIENFNLKEELEHYEEEMEDE